MRFNGPELGAWYASDDLRTAAAEVGHHLRRETVARSLATMTRTYRAYAVLGDYLDIRGQQAKRPDVYASDRYDASQKLGDEVRASGAQDCSMTACDAGPVSTLSRIARATSQTLCRQIISKTATSRTIDVRKLSL